MIIAAGFLVLAAILVMQQRREVGVGCVVVLLLILLMAGAGLATPNDKLERIHNSVHQYNAEMMRQSIRRNQEDLRRYERMHR